MLIEKELFEKWANKYENDIYSLKDRYPFAGYFDVIEHIKTTLKTNNISSILDLGVGTGLMLSKIIGDTMHRYKGCDFSPKMVHYAKERLSSGTLFVHDIRKPEIPTELVGQSFGLVYSAYTFHHFNTETKIEIIKTYMDLLEANGKFLLADISFDNEAALNQTKKEEGDRWDAEEDMGYFRKEEFMTALRQAGFHVTYNKISYCAGIYDISLES